MLKFWNRKRNILSVSTLILTVGLIQGCSSAGKDIHFKSRLPTQETPLIKADSDFLFGFEMDAESSRYTFQPTDNLVSNYHLNNDISYFSSQKGLNGFDLSMDLRKSYEEIYIKGNVSLDFAEVQINPSPFLGMTGNWFINLNAGVYLTSATISSGSDSCGLFCFSNSSDRASDQLKENEIKTTQSGREKKVGGLLGYKASEKNILTLSYQWMDYEMSASVSKTGMSELNLKEKYYASGYGVGFFHQLSARSLLGITADQVDMHFRNKIDPQTVLGVRMLVGF